MRFNICFNDLMLRLLRFCSSIERAGFTASTWLWREVWIHMSDLCWDKFEEFEWKTFAASFSLLGLLDGESSPKKQNKKKPSTTKHDQSKQIHFPQNSTPHCRERCSLPFLFLGSGSSLLIVSNSFHLEGPQMIIRLDTFRSLHYQGSAPPQQNESSSPNVMEIQSRMISFFAWGLMSRNCQPKIETKLPKGGLFRNSKRKIRVNFCIFRISLWRNSCGSSKSWAPNGLVKFKAFTQSFAFTVVVQTKESR